MKTFAQLVADAEKIQADIEKAKAREKPAVAKRIREAIAMYGLTPKDLFSAATQSSKKQAPRKQAKVKKAKAPVKKAAGKHGGKRPIKYRDGSNTWSGGGSMARWLRDKKDAGEDIEKYRVAD